MSRYARSTCALFVLLSVLLCFSGEPSHWQGRYLYEVDYGKNVAGTGMVVEYTLTINMPGDSPGAVLVMQGYQTDETILCDVAYTKSDASFSFKSYDNGQIKNKYGVELYRPGQMLFTLAWVNLKGSERLITHWKGLKPEDKRKSGFRKLSTRP